MELYIVPLILIVADIILVIKIFVDVEDINIGMLNLLRSILTSTIIIAASSVISDYKKEGKTISPKYELIQEPVYKKIN